jgi:hypothetical protein
MHKHIDKEALTTSLTTTSPSLTLSWLKKPDIAPDPYAILHDVPELTSKKRTFERIKRRTAGCNLHFPYFTDHYK